jgi:hypothetical protein
MVMESKRTARKAIANAQDKRWAAAKNTVKTAPIKAAKKSPTDEEACHAYVSGTRFPWIACLFQKL